MRQYKYTNHIINQKKSAVNINENAWDMHDRRYKLMPIHQTIKFDCTIFKG
jgi:hypothetical protein